MKDDSLSDTSDLNYCPKCDDSHDYRIDCSVGKQEPDPLLAKHEPALNVYATLIWNAAIEAAAKCVDKDTRCDQAGYEFGPALEIRRLKK